MSQYSGATQFSQYGGNTLTGSANSETRPATLTYPDGSVFDSTVPGSLVTFEPRQATGYATEAQIELVARLIRRFLGLVYLDSHDITDREALTHWRIWLQVREEPTPVQGWIIGFSMNGGDNKRFCLYEPPYDPLEECFKIMDGIMGSEYWRNDYVQYNLDCQSDPVDLTTAIYNGEQKSVRALLKHVAAENHAGKHLLVVEFETYST